MRTAVQAMGVLAILVGLAGGAVAEEDCRSQCRATTTTCTDKAQMAHVQCFAKVNAKMAKAHRAAEKAKIPDKVREKADQAAQKGRKACEKAHSKLIKVCDQLITKCEAKCEKAEKDAEKAKKAKKATEEPPAR